MSRRLARELAFTVLFQSDVGKNPWREVLPRTLKENELPDSSQVFLSELVSGTIQHLSEVDAEIAKYAQDWKLERMANTDRNILRMAVFELRFRPDIPSSVTVNEAVELAKRYGDEESGKFVNGILGNVVRNLEQTEQSEEKS
jgi:N utilization substance protein B